MLGYARKSDDFSERIQQKFEVRVRDLAKDKQDAIREVKKIEEERDGMLLEYEKEMNLLKKKYEGKSNEILKKRHEEITSHQEVFKYFWMKVLVNSKGTYNLITDDDKKPLKSLSNITFAKSEDQKNIKLRFEFQENEFFDNLFIEKEYQLGNDFLIKSIKSTPINWKSGKKYYAKQTMKKMKNNKTGEVKEMTCETCEPSFFNFFCELTFPSKENIRQLTPDKEKDFSQALDNEYEIMTEIIEEIIPHACEYYVGVTHDNEEFAKYIEASLF